MSTASVCNPYYDHPPIIEAVIGITFAQPITEKVLATADRRFAKHYPNHQKQEHVSLYVNHFVGPDSRLVHSTQEQAINGHRRMNSNMDELAVLMPNALTVSQLAPYKGWDAFITRFKRDLALYKRSGTFREISRIGVRYINRVDIPSSDNVVEHEQYLNVYPQVPDALGSLLGYGMQCTFRLDGIGCQVTINTAPVLSPTLGHASFMVDVDVYKTTDFPMNNADVFELLERIRAEKNRIFESCITQRAREEIFGHANS